MSGPNDNQSDIGEKKYLYIKNWEKYQPGYTNGKQSRWVKSWTDKPSDHEYSRLTLAERGLLADIRDLRGRLGKNPPNDANYISLACQLQRGCRTNARRLLDNLISNGFLVLTNQQNDEKNRSQIRVDKIRREKNIPPTPQRGNCSRPKKQDAEPFELPSWIPVEAWTSYLEMRYQIRKPMTRKAMEIAVKTLEQLQSDGHEPGAVIAQSVFNSWQGLFPIKSFGENTNGRHDTSGNKAAAAEGYRRFMERRSQMASGAGGGVGG